MKIKSNFHSHKLVSWYSLPEEELQWNPCYPSDRGIESFVKVYGEWIDVYSLPTATDPAWDRQAGNMVFKIANHVGDYGWDIDSTHTPYTPDGEAGWVIVGKVVK